MSENNDMGSFEIKSASWIQPLVWIVFAVRFFFEWQKTGLTSSFIAMLAFLALVPSAYLAPLKLNLPFKEMFSQPRVELPLWVYVSKVAGIFYSWSIFYCPS